MPCGLRACVTSFAAPEHFFVEMGIDLSDKFPKAGGSRCASRKNSPALFGNEEGDD
jgi:hypothetical protein